ncbi:MAG: shikimate dehydrogenase [Alphaproteobacteria bacterium]|nr:shikimate dehydrogenase [Alphaproteobacteria bacterium]
MSRPQSGRRPAPAATETPAAAPGSVLVGLIGAGIRESRSPRLHEREGDAQGIRYVYKLIDLDVLGLGVEALPGLLTAAERLGFAGLNVTHPCKQAVIAHLDALDDDASALQAVNTVVLRDGRRIGHNTDWSGFAESFRRELADAGRGRVALFGAGGAGAAVAYALLTLGAGELAVVDTDRRRAEALAEALSARFGAGRVVARTDADGAIAGADGVVNATPCGMAKYPGMAFPARLLRPDLWVAEIVYFPLETELLGRARACGCRTMSGAGMAVFQAVEAFRLFTGRAADPERMLRHFAEM